MNRNKELKNQYKLSVRAVGIYQIRNVANDRVLIGSATDLNGIINRHKFELKTGGHRNNQLQRDWNTEGEDNFAFEILEELVPRDGMDIDKELGFLERLWLEKLKPFGENGYNVKKKTRGELLMLAAENRNKYQ